MLAARRFCIEMSEARRAHVFHLFLPFLARSSGKMDTGGKRKRERRERKRERGKQKGWKMREVTMYKRDENHFSTGGKCFARAFPSLAQVIITIRRD